MRFVHAGYFETMGIPLLSGRQFEPGDGADAGDGPVPVVIDRRLAQQFFPGEDPVGQRINQGPDGIIVGVVGSIKHGTLEEESKATVYYPYRRMSWVNTLTGVIRTSGSPITLAQLQGEMAAVDPRLPVFDLRTMRDRIEGSLGPRKLGTTVLTGFGLTALLLALLGVYGVLSYSISQRTRELGIRLALGARPRELVSAVTGSGLVLGGIGVATGLLLFAGANRLLQSLVYGVKVMDPVAIGAGILLLGTGVLVASLLPARRIVRVDPTTALREE
jgi:putative ABC transport system permease protein